MIQFTRDDWGAQADRGGRQPNPVSLVVIHHTWKPHLDPGASLAEERSAVRGIERFHSVERGWLGIGYNWLISQNGHVYEGRGWGRVGAHAAGVNSSSVGVCFIVNGDDQALSPAAIEACHALLAEGVEANRLTPDFEIAGHRDYAQKSCPGDNIYPHLEALRPQ